MTREIITGTAKKDGFNRKDINLKVNKLISLITENSDGDGKILSGLVIYALKKEFNNES